MALADTARLVAALELQDRFTGPARNAERSLGSLDRKMGTLGRGADTLSRGVGSAVTNIARIGAGVAVGGIAVLATQIRAGVDSLNELESVTTATNTVIASTQGVAGQTAQDIRNLAEEYESLNATIDDKVIQSGANMLLTFTNVREDAFEPALEAALNLNEAMGGGEEGLQANIIKVGRALQDPTRGFSALARSGVIFTDQQKEQIRTLQESGDLLGAQQVILDELTTQFGGRFAAAGDTAAGSQAALRDRIEDVQKALAGPLLPAIDRVRDRLIDFLGSDRVLAGADRLGDAIANLFTDENLDKGVGFLEDTLDNLSTFDWSQIGGGFSAVTAGLAGLPWAAIGDAARLLGTGSKALLDAFLGLPGWVQTAVLTGWGLNKLTGGAVTGLIGQLASGLIKGVLNMNAGVVNINAAAVRGPGGLPVGGAPVGGGRGIGGLAGLAAGIVGIGTAALAADLLEEPSEQIARDLHQAFLSDNPLAGVTMEDMEWPFGPKNTPTILPELFGGNGLLGGTAAFTPPPGGPAGSTGTQEWARGLDEVRQEVENGTAQWARTAADFVDGLNATERAAKRGEEATHKFNMSEGRRFGTLTARVATQAALLQGVKSNTGTHTALLGGILRKPSTTSTTVNVATKVFVSGSQVNQTLSSLTQTIGAAGGMSVRGL